MWGNFVEGELERAAEQGKTAEQRMDYRKQMMEHLMDGDFNRSKPEDDDEQEAKPRSTGFRDPASLVKGKAS